MLLYRLLAQEFKATESKPLNIGNVDFWMDQDELVYSLPTSRWDPVEMGIEVAEMAETNPNVVAIVQLFA